MANIYGVDLGTCNLKIFNKHTNKIIKEKNTISIINKNQLYAYGDNAYAMYEKAPEHIQVSFPVVGGVIGGGLANQENLFGGAFASAKAKMLQKAKERGGNAVVGMSVNVTSPGNLNNIIVIVTGTAVKVEKKD